MTSTKATFVGSYLFSKAIKKACRVNTYAKNLWKDAVKTDEHLTGLNLCKKSTQHKGFIQSKKHCLVYLMFFIGFGPLAKWCFKNSECVKSLFCNKNHGGEADGVRFSASL